jgi:hypothetical protein
MDPIVFTLQLHEKQFFWDIIAEYKNRKLETLIIIFLEISPPAFWQGGLNIYRNSKRKASVDQARHCSLIILSSTRRRSLNATGLVKIGRFKWDYFLKKALIIILRL